MVVVVVLLLLVHASAGLLGESILISRPTSSFGIGIVVLNAMVNALFVIVHLGQSRGSGLLFEEIEYG